VAWVDVYAGHYLEARILGTELVRAFLESLRIFRRPPVTQGRSGIERPPMIVKAVRELVPIQPASGSIIDCIIGSRIEHRWF